MSRITREEVDRVASLARLSLSEQEAQRMVEDLDTILGYVETLRELDTRGIDPTSHPIPLPTPLREDRAAEPMPAELAVANAPRRAGSAFVVPRVIEGEEEG